MFNQETLKQLLQETEIWHEHWLFFLCTIVATVAGSVAGATASSRVRMDAFGVICCGTIAALGGGTLRDIMLSGHHSISGEPIRVYWTIASGFVYLYISAATSLLLFFLTRFITLPVGTIRVADAFAMALFTIIGVSKAQLAGADPLVCVVMGTCTGVAGGILRDVLTGNVPFVFRPGELYATPAALGSILYIFLQAVQSPHWLSYFGSVIVIFGMRMAAVYLNWQLPAYRPLFDSSVVESEHPAHKDEEK